MSYIQCKICLSEHKDFAEKLILKGLSTSQVAKELTLKGLIINQASVNRHKTRHMLEHADKIADLAIPKHNTKHSRNDYTKIDVNKVYDFDIKNLEYDDIVKEHNTINQLINKILKKQLAIVADLQDKYISGNAKYPHEEIKGLQSVQDMTIKFQTFSKDLISELKKIYEQHLTDKEKLLAIQAEKQKFELEKDRGEWMKTTEVHNLYGEGMKKIASWIDSVPDEIIFRCGIKDENYYVIQEIFDRKRDELYTEIIEISEKTTL